MADKIENGGPAFAHAVVSVDNNGQPLRPNEVEGLGFGLTIRDWFAGQAISSVPLRSWDHLGPNDEDRIQAWAKCSYLIADAMIAARKAGA